MPTAAVPSALVSNLEQGNDIQTSSGTSRVQRFTTGSNTDGYTLSSIGVISEDAEDDAFSATVCPVNAQGYPPSPPATVASDTSCWALTPPGDFSPGLLTFTASGSVPLAASTTYTVVFRPTSSTVHFDATSSDAEDGSPAGWSINNSYDFYSTSGAAYRTDSHSRAVRIAVRGRDGTTPTAPGAPTNFMATAGDGEVTLSWAAPASDGGAAITEYEYRYSTGSTVLPSTLWTDVTDGSDDGDSTADETGVTVPSLTNGTEYAFEVRAVNSAGDGTAAGPVTATPAPSVSIAAVYPTAVIRVANPEFRVTISAAQTSAVTVNISIAQAANYLSSTTQSIEIQANQTSATKKFSSFYSGTTSGDLTATVVAGTGYVPAATPANAATVTVLAPGLGAGVLSYFWAEAAHSVEEGDSRGRRGDAAHRRGRAQAAGEHGYSTAITDPGTDGRGGHGDGRRRPASRPPRGTPASGAYCAERLVGRRRGVHGLEGPIRSRPSEDSAYEGNERFKILLTRCRRRHR